jgi:hypothetical protein
MKHPKEKIQKKNWRFGSSTPDLRVHARCNDPPQNQAQKTWCGSFASNPFARQQRETTWSAGWLHCHER